MLKVDRVNYFYSDVQVLTDVSLTVNDGEFIAIFGPNGHGKSTLLKVICGLLKPASGTVIYDGIQISSLSIEKIVQMGLVYIPEDRNLFPEMTVMENLICGAFNKNARTKESTNLEFIFHLFPRLKDLSKRLASSLSGGEARMLAIGRGLMSNPRFIAIDEPSFGLAPNLIVSTFHAINEIRARGVSVLVVEQNTMITKGYTSRVYILEDGKMMFEGSKEEADNNEEVRKVFLGL